ncbi:MAG: sigma 54-interacting transcriptional regulator [Deltaproteobacteria bacterium]|nr:sigma 54-interacting transcriptional regulator [Deltaproteobacteria bacterium]
MIRIDVTRGDGTARSVTRADGDAQPIRIGRVVDNDLVLDARYLSSEHARVAWSGERFVVQDLRSTNGTVVVRRGERLKLDDSNGRQSALEDGDLLELGVPEDPVVLAVTVKEEADATHVVAVRSIDDLRPAALEIEKQPSLLRSVYESSVWIGAATELDEVLRRLGDAVLSLVQKATHVTIALRDDDDPDPKSTKVPTYVPVLTRVRGEQSAGAIPLTRSVFRKVVQERAAVLAADAPAEVGSASLLGAQIRSTLGIPLWKGEEILGILQVDNRASAATGAAGVFATPDLDLLSLLATNASLAIANARLIQRLHFAEEKARKENTFLKGREEKREGKREIIGVSKPMEELRQKLDKVVNTRVTVLIEGETGVGKELIASAVHYKSSRRDKLFVAQNCAAMPENLLESELFGHKKGSFTGATEDKRGLFELADGGTLFLDEIGEMPLSLQAKLLRALQEGEIRPVGANKPIHVNVRIVTATNRNLKKEVEEKRFREDLYYRLAVFPLRVPALRERREDIPLLAGHFLQKYAHEIGKSISGFSQQTMELLQAYDWPGNVRELENEVQRIVIQIEPGGFATPDLLSPRIRQVDSVVDRAAPKKGTLKEMMDQLEKYILIESLREHGNNKTAAARTLGITREGLHKKLRAFGIS